MFRYTLFLVLIIILIPNFSNGSKERIHLWDTIELTTVLPKPWKETKLTLHYEGSINNRRIKKMTLLIGGNAIIIPNEAYVDLEPIKIETIRIQSELHNPYGLGVGIYIVFNYGANNENTAHIVTRDGKLKYRKLRVKIDDRSWKMYKKEF